MKHITEESQGAKVWICGEGGRRTEGPARRESGPLRICISASSRDSLDEASALVQDLLQSTHEDYERFRTRDICTPASEIACDTSAIACTFKVGIAEDSSFQVVKRLLGKSGKNMKRIEADSGGASVQLCGRRSQNKHDEEGPLEMRVSATTQASFDAAAASVMALISRIHSDYREFCALKGLQAPLLPGVCEAELCEPLS